MRPVWSVLLYATISRDIERLPLMQALDALQRATGAGDVRVTAQLYETGSVTRYHLVRGERRSEAMPGRDFSRLDSLREFLASDGEAARRALIVYGHGSGLRRGGDDEGPRPVGPPPPPVVRIGPDANSNLFLENDVLRSAIVASQKAPLDLLCFNGCSMQMLEVAGEFDKVSTLQIGSQVDAQIWPYDRFAEALQKGLSPEELAKALVNAVNEQLVPNERQDTISVFRSDGVSSIIDALQALAATALQLFTQRREAIRRAANDALHVYSAYHVDLVSLARLLGKIPELTQPAKHVEARVNAARVAMAAHSDWGATQGLSVFCPLDPDLNLGPPYRGTRFQDSPWEQLLTELNRGTPRGLSAPILKG